MSVIVITGARGYIGSALAEQLAGEGKALRLVSRTSEALRLETMRTANIEYWKADLRRPQDWSRLLDGASAVVHLSSRTNLRAAEDDAESDRVLNVEPVYALVRAAEHCRATVAVIFASSTSIAGDAHANPVNENTPDRPCSVYDRHKLECEIVLRDVVRRGMLQACSLRLPTVYGYGAGVTSTNPNRGILNVMIRRASRGEPLTLYGDGSVVRDFIHIDDVCDAFRRAIARPDICRGTHYVIATGRGYTLAEAFRCVAQEAYRVMGREVEISYVPEPPSLHPIERSNFVGNAAVFHKLTGWSPQVDLRSGIRDYFERLLAPAQAAGMA
jgi:nucleoside-diphosphate-sugar epimerase